MEARLEPKLARCAGRTPYFHPWVDKVAQVVTNGAQSGSRGAQSTPKRHLNGVKVGHKVSKTCSRSPNMMQNGDQQLEKCLPMGGLPLSYIYIIYLYIYIERERENYIKNKKKRKNVFFTIKHNFLWSIHRGGCRGNRSSLFAKKG